MTTAIATTPTAASPGEAVTLSITGALAGRVGEFEIISVPTTSALSVGMILDANGKLPVPTIEDPETVFTPDVAGVYEDRETILGARRAG